MFELIALIILILSLGGIFVILAKKVPELAILPKNGKTGFKKHRLILELEKKFRALHFDLFVKKLLLHKLLSWAKCLVLKVEVWLDNLLHGIRKNAQQINKPK